MHIFDKSPEELCSELAEEILAKDAARFDYLGIRIPINSEDYPHSSTINYHLAIRNKEWEALQRYHHEQSILCSNEGDWEGAAREMVISAAMKEMRNQ